MFRNNYDNDVITFSPQGRIFQVEYAQEAVKQGSAVVGIVSKSHAVLVALKRNAEDLSSYQKKIIPVDTHLGLALAGLASDARVLSNFMKRQALSSKMTYGRPIPVERLVTQIGDRAQMNTQQYSNRPYGVGLLVAGVDATGPHLFEFSPTGMTQEMLACAIGARSQMARTYLERQLDDFAACGRDELVVHGIKALKETLSQDKELTIENCSIGIVGISAGDGKRKIEGFKLYDGADVAPLLEKALEGEGRTEGAEEGAQAEGAGSGESMQVDS